MRRLLMPLAAVTVLGLACPAAAAECKLSVIGELPVVMEGFRPLLAMKIKGEDVFFVVDTGATTSTIAPEVVERLRLNTVPVPGVRVFGIGGEVLNVKAVNISEVFIGRFVSRNVRFMVAPPGRFFGGKIGGLIGQDFLGVFDTEYDFANGVIRLMKAEGCDKAPLAYWSPQHAQAEMYVEGGRGGHIRTVVLVNGQKVRAILDTGAPLSILDIDVAAKAGVTPDSPGSSQEGTVGGLGEARFTQYVAPVKSFGLGEETVQNTRLRIGNLDVNTPKEAATGSRLSTKVVDFPEMLIGADFFLTHRIYVASSRRRLYFTHNGKGGVFARPMGSAQVDQPAGVSSGASGAP